MGGSELAVSTMKALIHPFPSIVQAAGGGTIVWRIFSWHTVVSNGHDLNFAAHLSLAVDHILSFPFQGYMPCRSAQIIPTCFFEHGCSQMSSTLTRSQSNRAFLGFNFCSIMDV